MLVQRDHILLITIILIGTHLGFLVWVWSEPWGLAILPFKGWSSSDRFQLEFCFAWLGTDSSSERGKQQPHNPRNRPRRKPTETMWSRSSRNAMKSCPGEFSDSTLDFIWMGKYFHRTSSVGQPSPTGKIFSFLAAAGNTANFNVFWLCIIETIFR